MGVVCDLQNKFHDELTLYINGGCLSRRDLLISISFPAVPFTLNSQKIIKKYQKFQNLILENTCLPLKINFEMYAGKNRHVLQMQKYLNSYLSDDLLGAFVHGSLGTYEEIDYSDFDGLVILKDEVFYSRRRLVKVARRLSQARKIMLDLDPLQHHGWFVLTEADLRYYCNAYFDVELFNYSKSLLNIKKSELNLHLRDSTKETYQALENMVNAIIREVEDKQISNMYQLKSLLSGFMLLPALYVQIRDGRGINKKQSFMASKKDFDSVAWRIMDEVSDIRPLWRYELSETKRKLLNHPFFLSRYVMKTYGVRIPKQILERLTPDFYSRMSNLAFLMKKKLEENRVHQYRIKA